MALEFLCGQDKGLFELLAACIAQHNTLAGPVDGWAWKIVQKTKADYPDMCGREMSMEEYWKSAISIVECVAGNYIAINVVIEDCDCLTCGDELPCHTADMDIADKVKRTFCYTTDGEWALYLLDITDNRT